MRLKRLEIVGFKSFVDPTVIDFDASIVGVVGPNGCGKSNVVDSIRWVMGEMSARSLRGRSMEDVIFNGSEKRSPFGMAEVSLTFSTEDGIAPSEYAGFTEITITRRLYRSGESEYLINKVPARLRDVIELFLGTGVGHKAYSIIEQGKIDFVINAKPEERRLLLEEAAGVSKFKSRKESALRKMESTELNVARLKDILHEVTRQINSLDRQVKKAERYKVLKNEVRELELRLSSLKFLELSAELNDLRALLENWTDKETTSTATLSTIENDLERGRLELMEKDAAHNTIQQQSFEVVSRLKLLEAQQEFSKRELQSHETAKESAHHEIIELKGRLETLQAEKEDQQKKHEDLESESGGSLIHLETAEKDWKEIEGFQIEQTRKIEKIKEERHLASSEIQGLDAEKRLYEERQIALKGQIAKAQVEWDEEGRHLEVQETSLQEKTTALQVIVEHCQSLQKEIETLRQDAAIKQERKEILGQEVKVRQEELVNKKSRLKSLLDLERNFEGYEEGVRSILQKKKESPQNKGIFGVVADFIETSPQYEMAVSAALGEKLQYVIVKSHEEGVEAIQFLKSQSTGRSSFIPLEVRESAPGNFSYQQSGVIGPLVDLIKIKDEYRKVAQYLLGDTVLVSTLTDALSLWKTDGHKMTLVTLEGEVVDAFGVVSGGTAGIPGKLLLEKKREIKELRSLTSEMEEEMSLKEDSFSQLEGSLSEIELDQQKLSRDVHEEELKRMSLSNEVRNLQEEYRRREATRQRLTLDLENLTQDLEKYTELLVNGEERRKTIFEALSEKDRWIETWSQELSSIQLRVRHSQERLTSLKIEAASLSERRSLIARESQRLIQIESDFHQQVDQKMASITNAHQKMTQLTQSLEEAVVEIEVLKKSREDLTVAQEEARTAYESLAASLREKEAQVRDFRKDNDLARSHTGDLRVTLSRAETEMSHLEQKVLERYSVDIKEVSASFVPQSATGSDNESTEPFNYDAEDKRLAELRSKLDQMSDVNLGAISEYEELKTRQDFLSQQIQDLEDSLDALKKAIQRINQTTKLRFESTFEKVNERFKTLFPRLFHGGRAELRLTHDEATHNAGVELLVQPPGKKLSHIGLLSGGEKAMSAMAFVFSIFLVKPSPFCILDEVDAPLDDLNTQRFHNLLSEMTPRTQFILITHNRRTMEKADLLYGVTMQEPGVSKLVSVRMNEAIKLAS